MTRIVFAALLVLLSAEYSAAQECTLDTELNAYRCHAESSVTAAEPTTPPPSAEIIGRIIAKIRKDPPPFHLTDDTDDQPELTWYGKTQELVLTFNTPQGELPVLYHVNGFAWWKGSQEETQ